MGYYSALQVEQLIDNLVFQFPGLAHPVLLPNPTAEGRSCKALRLGTQAVSSKDTVLITGGVHGCEWGSCEIALNLATVLLRAKAEQAGLGFGGTPGTGAGHIGGTTFHAQQIQALWAQRDILIFPLVNPDGREFSQVQAGPADAAWRKNRRRIFSNGLLRGIGVDINRNFNFVFDLNNFAPNAAPVASADPSNTYYQGPEPDSEAETQNVISLLDTTPHIGWLVDLHSAGQSMCFAWNHDDAQTTDSTMNFRATRARGKIGTPGPSSYQEFIAQPDLARLQQLAKRFADDARTVNQTVYDIRPAYWNNAYPGTSHDYAFSRHLADTSKSKVLGFVCEWGDMNCQPPWVDMQAIIEEVTAGLIGFCIETI